MTTGLLLLAGSSLLDTGWPLSGGNPALIATAGLLFVLAYGLKAFGWRRLFRPTERPQPIALAAAGGGASILGVVLPGRFDEVVRLTIVRRYPGCPVCMGGLSLSLLTLGLIDTVALFPIAATAAAMPGNSGLVRAGFGLVAAGGIGATVVILLLPRVSSWTRIARFRLVQWLAPRATPWRDASRAVGLVLGSWLVRAVAVFLLLHTFGIALSFPLALMFLVAGAASAAIPIGPAGAATQVAAGTTLLVLWGVSASQALGFALAAHILLVLAGASIFLAAAAWRMGVQAWCLMPVRRSRPLGPPSGP